MLRVLQLIKRVEGEDSDNDTQVCEAWQRYNLARLRVWQECANGVHGLTRVHCHSRGDAHTVAYAVGEKRQHADGWVPHWYQWTGGVAAVDCRAYVQAHAGRLRFACLADGTLAQALVSLEVTEAWHALDCERLLDNAAYNGMTQRVLNGTSGNAGDLRGELALYMLDAIETWRPDVFCVDRDYAAISGGSGLTAQWERWAWTVCNAHRINYCRKYRPTAPLTNLSTGEGFDMLRNTLQYTLQQSKPIPLGWGLIVGVDESGYGPSVRRTPTGRAIPR